MAKPDTSRIDTLEAIMADKRKHESYLAKLEDKRASTPSHVFNRLRDEYLTKLTDLQVRASMEAESLSEGLKADEAAVAEIESRLAAVTEERIEGELRAEVGEYDPKEWGKKLEALNSTIAQIEKERTAKVAAFERTSSLLIEARGAAEPVSVPPPEPPSAPLPPLAPASVAPIMPPPPVRQTPMGQPVSAPTLAPALAPVAPVARTSSPTPTALPVPPSPAPAPPPLAEPASPAVAAPKSPAPDAPMAGSPSFDELAFLNSVVGRASQQVRADEQPPVAPPAPRATTNARPAEGDDGGSGPLGRPTPRTSQAIKTLKCQECGTLNYPTEWYCERCGGELAAL